MTDRLRTFILDALRKMNYDVSDVTGDTDLGPAGLDLESLALADLAVQMEDEFGVRFDEDEMETLALMTLDEFTAVLAGRVGTATVAGAPDRGVVAAEPA